MKPLPHHYDVHLSGGPSGYAELSAVVLRDLSFPFPLVTWPQV